MPRRQISFQQGEYYHMYNRGVDRQPIFRVRDNYYYLLHLAKKYSHKLDITVIACCLMPNHYHFLVRQDGSQAAGLFPQRIFNAYVKAFNKKFGRKGTLFEGRYQAVHIGETAYLHHLCRYIHANPVMAGLVDRVDDWPYSNFQEWMHSGEGKLVDDQFIEDHFPDREEYREFIQHYLDDSRCLPKEAEKFMLD